MRGGVHDPRVPQFGQAMSARPFSGARPLRSWNSSSRWSARKRLWQDWHSESGSVKVHLGAEDGFRPARKAHPALVVADLGEFVAERDLEVRWDDEIPGVVRCHVDDPFGNRIELIGG